MRKAAGCILNVFNKTKTKTKSPTHPTSPHPTPPHPAPLFLTLPTTHPSLPRNHKKDRKTNSQKTGTLASQIVRERQHIGHRRLVTPFVKRPAAELGRYGSWEVGGLAKGYRSPRIDQAPLLRKSTPTPGTYNCCSLFTKGGPRMTVLAAPSVPMAGPCLSVGPSRGGVS